jgi:hypothetical protein
MLGLNVKRGVATTLERIHNSAGFEFGKLEVLWSGSTAGIIFDRNDWKCDAKLIFPSIDELANIPQETFNNLIGYALHELGHAWYTDNKPWDWAREQHGTFVSNLINGLEDPRIERLVIESGRAPNSRVLFENLVNSILKRDGYVKADDKRNIPFLLAIEGRRLNGYDVCVPSIVNASPWAKHIKWALKRAQVAKDTRTIAKIAIELFERIKEQEKQKPQQPEQGQGQPSDGQPDESTSQDDNGSDDANGQGEGNPSDGSENPSEGGSDADDGGSDTNGQPTDGQPDDGQPADGQGGDGQDGDKPSDQTGGGYSNEDFEGGRDVEPSDFIENELGKHAKVDGSLVHRPSIGKPSFTTFSWI